MSDAPITIEIDGKSVTTRKGAMLIEAADQAGIRIPRFCYHKKLSVAANCRMCLVEVERAPKPLPACATPVTDGMKVFTHSEKALQAQRSVMEFLLINHPLDCPICDQGGECELQDLAMGYGGDVSRFTERKRVVPDKNIGPLIATDLTRCIHCTRCIRFGEEIAGMPELGATGRGEHMRIGMFVERNLDSEMSGNVIDVCPVGALTSKPFRFTARAWEMMQRDSVAPHDAAGSNIHVHVHSGKARVMRVVPRENEAINEVWLSDRDRFSYTGLYADDRLLTPMVKDNGQWRETDWQSALSKTRSGLQSVIDARGASRLGALTAPTATLEECFLLQRLIRGLGSGNIDHRIRELDFSDQNAMPTAPGLGFSLNSLASASDIWLIGANTRRDAPIVNHRIRMAALSGARVNGLASVGLDANFPLLSNWIVPPAALLDELLAVAGALGVKVSGSKALIARAAETKPRQRHTNLAAQLREGTDVVIVLGAEVNGSPWAGAIRATAALIATAVDARLGLFTDGPNGAGAWLSGAIPHRAVGGQALDEPGMHTVQMLSDGLDAFVLLNVEPEMDSALGEAALNALSAAEFVVCVTPYASDTMREYADVLLPQAPFAETSGTYVNAEGAVQSFAGCAPPQGEARPAWKILRVLGNAFELSGFDQESSRDVLAEFESIAAQHALAPAAFDGEVGIGEAAGSGVVRIPERGTYVQDSLVRRAGPLQATTLAAKSRCLRANTAMAAREGLVAGRRARVTTARGEVELEVLVDDLIADGCVVVPAADMGTAALGMDYANVEVKPA